VIRARRQSRARDSTDDGPSAGSEGGSERTLQATGGSNSRVATRARLATHPSILYPIYWRRVAKRTALPRESKEQNISPMSGNSSHEASCRVVSWRRIRESIHDEFSQSALSLSSHPPEAEAVNSLTQLNKFRKYLRGCNSRNFHSL